MNLNIVESFLNEICLVRGLSNKTFEAYKSDLEDFFNFLKLQKYNIKELNRDLLSLYFEDLKNRGLKRSSFRRKFSCLNQFGKFLLKEKILSENPLKKEFLPKKTLILPKIISDHDIQKMFSYFDQFQLITTKKQQFHFLRNKAIFYLIADSGMRVSELCSIKLSDILSVILNFEKTDDRFFFLKITGKRNKERYVPITRESIVVLKEYNQYKEAIFQIEKNQYLFPSRSLNRHITRVFVFKLIKDIANSVGIKNNIHPHMFRHSFATKLLKNDIDIRYIQKILGHSSIETTTIYTKVEDQEMIDLLKKHPLNFL